MSTMCPAVFVRLQPYRFAGRARAITIHTGTGRGRLPHRPIPPRPSGFGGSRELFPRYTAQMFDAITPAVTAADLTLGFLRRLEPACSEEAFER